MCSYDEATLLSATFHNHTRQIALRLKKDDPITAKGYLHAAREHGRLRSFSVITLHSYPGKAQEK